MARRCRNAYHYCQNEAVSDTGNGYSQRLCAECLANRRAKQARSAAQPNCRCGGKLPFGATQCRGCDRRQEESQKQLDDLVHEIAVDVMEEIRQMCRRY